LRDSEAQRVPERGKEILADLFEMGFAAEGLVRQE